ncbi:MAG TPA: hypothetical protein DDZ89_21495 [Clostridiales bacterium]|nr:hypothetical protein [Clostridiales bacterium]
MKRTISLLLCVLMIFSFGCSENKLENKPRKTISMPPETSNRPVSLQVEKNENVLTVLYPYMNVKNEYAKVFDQLSGLCQKNLGLTIRLLTPSGPNSDNPRETLLHPRVEFYTHTLQSMMDAGIGPDIFFTMSMYDEVVRHNYKLTGISGFPNDLLNLISYGYAADLSPYINDQTPFLKQYRADMSHLDPLTEYNGRVYGILSPPDYKGLPVFVIQRNLNLQLSDRSHTTLKDAIDACIELNQKNLVTVHDRIVFNTDIIYSKIISDAGYYFAFEDTRYMYYFQMNDRLYKLHRIDDTPILDEVKKYIKLFEEASIFTSSDEKQELIAGLMSYYSFINSKLDLLSYDIFFLEDIPSDSRRVNNIFVVSDRCANKQGATKIIDFLFSDPEANFLLKYGLDGVTYEDDPGNGVMHTNSIYSQYSVMAGHTVDYDAVVGEYLLCDNRQKELTQRYIQNVHVIPFLDLVVNSKTNKEHRTVFDAINDLFWTRKDPEKPPVGMEDFLVGNDSLLAKTILPNIFEEKSNPYKYSFGEIVERIMDTRNDEFINSLQEIIDDYLLDRNPNR